MMAKYPSHFYESIRVEIAVSQMQHDLRKLLPTIRDKTIWEKIDANIAQWPKATEKFEMEALHDFWNFFGSFTRGLKLKSLLQWVTAENVIWTREDVPTSQIVITWNFPGLDFAWPAPIRAQDILNAFNLSNMEKKKEFLKKDSDFRSDRFAPRDHFRVILFHDQKGGIWSPVSGYYALEGNRRVVRAIIYDNETIPAYVGRFRKKNDQLPENYWLRSGLLADLNFLAMEYDKKGDSQAFLIVRKFYQLLLRDFDLARIITFDKIFKHMEKSERLMIELLKENMEE